jgi:hypothetical protein
VIVVLDVDGGQRDRAAGTLGVGTGCMDMLCCRQFETSAIVVSKVERRRGGRDTNRAIGGRRNIAFKLVDAGHG